jgi:hypothetical protein
VIKLKASPASEAGTQQQADVDADPPFSVKDWWTPEAEAEPTQPVTERRVLQLKASPPPETEVEHESEDRADLPSSSQDWWLPGSETDGQPKVEDESPQEA